MKIGNYACQDNDVEGLALSQEGQESHQEMG